jgi:Ca-activated chloride channel family protein
MGNPRGVWSALIFALITLFAANHDGVRGSQDLGPLPLQPAGSRDSAYQSALIRVESNLVRVPVSVTDDAGHAVLDLKPGDFRIEENGVEEKLARLADPGETPLEMALLLDISGSVHPRFEFERQAAARFLRRILRAADALTIVCISQRPGLIQPRTADIEEALQALRLIQPTESSTAFYDAVVMAAHLLRRTHAPDSRRVQVILSDGEDNDSESFGLREMLQEVQRADCIVYSINPAASSIRLNKVSAEGQKTLFALATQTGGAAFLPDKDDELDSIFDRLALELRAQYMLEYYSSGQRTDGSFRQIVVRTPTRPGLRIRARQGYYSARG